MKVGPARDTLGSMVVTETSAARIEPLAELERLYEAEGAALRQALSRLAPELDADDLLHEVFLTAVRRVGEFGRSSEPLGWLYGVAVKIASTRRRTARLRRFLGQRLREVTPEVDAPSRTREQQDAQRLVLAALETLSSAKRETFVLFELQGLSGEAVAAALGVPVQTVWTRLFHARKDLALALRREMKLEADRSGLSRKDLEP